MYTHHLDSSVTILPRMLLHPTHAHTQTHARFAELLKKLQNLHPKDFGLYLLRLKIFSDIATMQLSN